jgi:hypothetical protein
MKSLAEQVSRLRFFAPRCYVGPSSLGPAASRGVYARERCESAGELLTLYPGFYYPPPPLHVVANVDGIPPHQVSDLNPVDDSEYKMSCSLGGFFDAKHEGAEDEYAVGHLVNHSIRRTNAVVVNFLWSDINPELKRVNSLDTSAFWYVSPEDLAVYYSQDCAPLAGCGILSATSIDRSEEIFINYRFSVAHQCRLKWYDS